MQRSLWNVRGAFALCAVVCGAIAFTGGHARAYEPFVLLKLDGAFVKWGDPMLGTGAAVRYAMVTQPTEFPQARNCEAMNSLEPSLARNKISAAQFRQEVDAAFAMWSQAADIRFERVADPARADILIGGQALPKGRAFADVRTRDGDRGATRTIDRALICLNPAQPWKVGFGGDAGAYDLRYTIAHEIGHAIGLNHPGPSGQLMGFKYAESFRTLQPGDLGGAISLYGSRDSDSAVRTARAPGKRPAELGLR